MSKKSKKGKIANAMAKKKEPKCRNCQLFNREKRECQVVILYGTERINLPVEPEDDCFFENKFTAIKQEIIGNEIVETKEEFVPADNIKQTRFWVEDPKTGKPTKGNGVVKIEYDGGFFGTGDIQDIDMSFFTDKE